MNVKEILTDKDNHYGFAIMILFIIIILFMIGANKDKEPGEFVNKYIYSIYISTRSMNLNSDLFVRLLKSFTLLFARCSTTSTIVIPLINS